ncbi:MAG: lamin tail domain-containing protein [Myxococcota bacterium]
MALVIREMHAPTDGALLNEEWLVVENAGDAPVSVAGLRLTAQPPRGRPRDVATIDPGFTIKPGEKHRIVTGSASRPAHGRAPDGPVPNYHLLLKTGYLQPDVVVRLLRNQIALVTAVYDPKFPSGAREA